MMSSQYQSQAKSEILIFPNTSDEFSRSHVIQCEYVLSDYIPVTLVEFVVRILQRQEPVNVETRRFEGPVASDINTIAFRSV